ncbi:hypothetical protein F6P61_05580 [Streptococcus suis]|nr:hypothetical protein [Streptococcus suis]
MGVKQSGDRLFQLNNLKRKIVDELFFIFRVLSRSQKGERNELWTANQRLTKKERFDSGTVCPQTQCDQAGCFQLGK